ncbi:MAG TPA: substrate-binding domain-containing protein [Ramlibacter sp.]
MDSTRATRRGIAWRRPLRAAAVLAAGWALAAAAVAAEVTVFAAPALQPVVAAMAPVFEQRTGNKVVVISDSIEAVAQRIRAGESFDVAVLPPALLEALGSDGAVSDGSIVNVARQPGPPQNTVYAAAVSTSASNSPPALSLLILLASEETQAVLPGHGLAAP